MPDYKEIRVNTVPAYTVTIGPGLLKDCGPRLREVIPPAIWRWSPIPPWGRCTWRR